MPHQCLQCGAVFQEGSREILRGCPNCGGTRFFYTRAPLSGGDLDRMRRSSEEEMRELVRKVLTEGAPIEPARESDGPPTQKGWVAIRNAPVKAGYSSVESFKRGEGDVFERKPSKPRKERPRPGPEVIRVLESGVYEIDIESLLRKNPIVIQKEGTYLIYLPSLFSEV